MGSGDMSLLQEEIIASRSILWLIDTLTMGVEISEADVEEEDATLQHILEE